jgi:hypothetical protein
METADSILGLQLAKGTSADGTLGNGDLGRALCRRSVHVYRMSSPMEFPIRVARGVHRDRDLVDLRSLWTFN